MTGYYKSGYLIMKRGKIVRHYLRTWFIIDFIATIPYSWFATDKDIDYWPDDDFDETAALSGTSVFHTLHSFLSTEKLAGTLSQFDLA